MAEFNPNKQIYDEVKKAAANQAILNLLESGVDANFIDPMIDVIVRAVTSGGTFDDLVDELEIYVLGNTEKLGRLDRYVKQVSSDILHQFSREYQEIVSQDIGLEFYQYTGNIIDDTRAFCVERVNKFYHKEEVKDWGGISTWQGRIEGTNSSNIFINLGGWNCRHQLIAVNTRFVPKEVIVRNIDNGNYTPTQKIKDLFGL